MTAGEAVFVDSGTWIAFVLTGRLLGHRGASTTNRCVLLDDTTRAQAAERVTLAVERKLRQGGVGSR